MSPGLRQGLLIACSGGALFVVAAAFARRQMMSLRYTILWVVIAALGVSGAVLTPLVKPVSEFFGMSPTGLLLASASVLLLTITILLSISVSSLQEKLRDVAEAHALLACKVEELGDRAEIDV